MSLASKIVGYMKGIFGLSPSPSGLIVAGPILSPNPTIIDQVTSDFTGGIILQPRSDVAGALRLRHGSGGVFVEILNDSSQRLIQMDLGSGFSTIPGFQYAWSNSTGDSNSRDTGLARVAGGVVQSTNGSAGAGWIQNTAGEGALAANFTKANATLGATNISFTVIAGRSYRIDGEFIMSNSVAGEGGQFDFGGGSCSATTFDLAVVGSNGTNTPGTTNSTSLTGAINYSSITGTNRVRFSGYLKVNAGGTLIVRAAENTTSTGTFTLGAGSWVALADTVAL
jgi:hypothetical protein